MSYRFASSLILSFSRLVARIHVEGLENAPAQGAYIAASNHLGRLDAALVFCLLERDDVTMLVAEKYKENPVFRWLVKELDAIWVDRFNADFGAMRAALNRLKEGNVLVLAPEGTRSPTGALIEGRDGSSYLAAKSGVPVVPVAITCSEDWRVVKSLKRLRRAQIYVKVGEPFTLPPLKSKEKEAALKQYTDEIMCRIAALLPPEYRGVYADHPRLAEILAEEKTETFQ